MRGFSFKNNFSTFDTYINYKAMKTLTKLYEASSSDKVIFASKTTTGGKTQLYSPIELEGLKLYGSNCIIEHKGQTYKNLKSYWVTSKQLEKIKEDQTVETSDF